jgi:5-methylcytosine-specific restriction endonuclease McrA
MSNELSHRRWRDYRAARIAELPPICTACGKYVNKELSGMHPLGPTIDHTTARANGGPKYSRANTTLMHRRCNTSKGVKPPKARRNQSRDW